MGVEIERKFLVRDPTVLAGRQGTAYRQGYVAMDGGRTVRVRSDGCQAYLTIKGPTVGFRRAEFEYEIPVTDADELLATLCSAPLIEKTRYRIPFRDRVWEVDVFAGANQGLIVAEVELPDEQAAIALPPWVGREVTGDPRYSNASLARQPFSRWGREGDGG